MHITRRLAWLAGVRRSDVITCGILLLVALLSGHRVAGAPQKKVRTLEWDPTVSLESRLLPDDEVVELHYDTDLVVSPSREPTNAKEVIRLQMGAWAKCAAVVFVTRVEGVSHNGLVITRFGGVARQVFRCRLPQGLSAGQSIEAEVWGGEMTIGHVLVRAFVDRVKPTFPLREEYLVLLRDPGPGESGGLYPVLGPLLIRDGRLQQVYPRPDEGRGVSLLHGMKLSDAVKEIRRFK